MAERKASHFGLYLLILAMTVMWSANYITSKVALQHFPPLLLVGLRNALAAVLMLAVYVRHLRNGAPLPERRDIPKLLALGLVGIAVNQMLFVSGMAHTTVGHAAITIGLTPIVVLMLAAAAGQERLSPARMAGMVVALAGVAVLQLAPGGANGASLTGDLLVFSAGFLFAIFTVQSKAQSKRIDGVTLNTFAYVAGAVTLLPAMIWLSPGHPYDRVTASAWASLVYMAVGPSVVCYLIFYHALSHITASRVSAFAYLQPLFATLMAVPTLGEYPSSALLTGGALVLAGVFMAERL